MSSIIRSNKRLAKRFALEAQVHLSRMRDVSPGKRVVVFPSNETWGPASNLRAWLMVPELRRMGWRVTLVPPRLSLSQRRRILRAERPDVILLQQTRHDLNRPKLYAPTPVVLDADDADYLDPRFHDMIVESAQDATAVIGGSRFVKECLGSHNRDANCIWTCTPTPTFRSPERPKDRPPIVAWAHGSPLGYEHEAALIQESLLLAAQRSHYTFWLFGTTEEKAAPWLQPLRQAGLTCVSIPSTDYDTYLAKVAQSAIGLQPVCVELSDFSRGKSFGKILAYLNGEVAVIASRTVDHPLFFRDGETGLLPENNPDEWADAIVSLVTDAVLRDRMATAAYQDFLDRLTMPTFARLLDPILQRASARGEGVSGLSSSSPVVRPAANGDRLA